MAISKERHLRKAGDTWPHILTLAYLVGFSLLIPFTLTPEGRIRIGSSVTVPRLETQDVVNVFDKQLEDMRGWAQLSREVRFPSKEQRLKVYLGNWFETCGPKFRFQRWNETMMLVEEHSGRLLEVFSRPETDGLFWLEPKVLAHCSESSWVLSIYCRDSANLTRAKKPVLMQYGDAVDPKGFGPVEVPIVKKSRPRLDYFGGCPSLERKEAVLWKLNSERHYGKLSLVAENDIPWEKKKTVAVFRGALTGITQDGLSQVNGDYNNCMISRRCRLVYMNDKSPLVDARLTGHKNVQGIISSNINGIDIFGDSISIQGHLEYKALIMMEGNDVSSGLKWALYSNSVVLMPRPHHTTWAMEELLEEWVHFIPLDQDLSNLQAQMEWVVANDEKANAIAQRGKAWIQDLFFAEQADEENEWIEEETMRHLSNHFEETDELASQVWLDDPIDEEDKTPGFDLNGKESAADLSLSNGMDRGNFPGPKPVAKRGPVEDSVSRSVPAIVPLPQVSPGAVSPATKTESRSLPKEHTLVGIPTVTGAHAPKTPSAGTEVDVRTQGQNPSALGMPNGGIDSQAGRSDEVRRNNDRDSEVGSVAQTLNKHGPLDSAKDTRAGGIEVDDGNGKPDKKLGIDEDGPPLRDGQLEKDIMSWSSVEGKVNR